MAVLLLTLMIFYSNIVHISTTNSSLNMESRIIKGYEVDISEYSYAAFLYFDNTRPRSCGASLIMVQAVITAAHCTDELHYKRGEHIYAFFGSTIPKYSKVVRTATAYKRHPKYDERNGKYNIAIIFLNNRVPLRHTIKKIPLITIDSKPGDVVWSAGWGKQYPKKLPDLSKGRHLRVSKQKILDRKYCDKYAGFKVSVSQHCSTYLAGHHYRDDAGNGLIVKKPTVMLVGVLSFVSSDVSVYTSVYRQRKWIIDTLKSLYTNYCKKKGKK